jgi:hypothetical protein
MRKNSGEQLSLFQDGTTRYSVSSICGTLACALYFFDKVLRNTTLLYCFLWVESHILK